MAQRESPLVSDFESQKHEGKKEDRALMWKIDFHLIPFLSLVYLLAFLGRSNIGNAKIEGLLEDLNMTDPQYLWTLTIFYFPYALFETPCNIVLKRLRPSVWFPTITIAWGLCLTLMGLVKDYQGLLVARFFLGLTQAGFYPGVTYYLSCWYKKNELGLRAAIFSAAATLSGSFGGLLAAGIAKMDGVGALPGWAWIFILEGMVTVLAGAASLWLIQDYPNTSKFLTPDEETRAIGRLKSDAQLSAGEAESFSLGRLWAACTDWKTGVGALIEMGLEGSLNAFALFLPTLIEQLGYESTRAQLLSVPPYALACVVTLVVGIGADRCGKRGIFNILCFALAIVGYIMNIVPSSGPTVRYAGMYLAASGIMPCLPNTVSWISNNIEGSYKRSIVLAITMTWGNVQGAVSSNLYRDEDAPDYTMGHAVVIAYLGIALAASVVFSALLRLGNSKREKGERKERIQKGKEEEAMELGDRHPDFRYTT